MGRHGFIYLIRSSSGEHKIGRSIDVGQRLSELQSNHEDQLTVIRTVETFSAADTELMFHDKFRSRRRHGEWFDLRTCDIEEFHDLADICDAQVRTAKERLGAEQLRQMMGQYHEQR